jgi:hypothetical protein
MDMDTNATGLVCEFFDPSAGDCKQLATGFEFVPGLGPVPYCPAHLQEMQRLNADIERTIAESKKDDVS